MAQYLTIPGVVEAEDLISANRGSDDRSFQIAIRHGDTGTYLFRAANDGTVIPLAVLMMDALTLALDDVVVASVSSAGGPDPLLSVELNAREVRTI